MRLIGTLIVALADGDDSLLAALSVTVAGAALTGTTLSTSGNGFFKASINRGADEIRYTLSYRGPFDANPAGGKVTQAHIHMAAIGANGPVVAWLYPSAPPPVQLPGRTQGTLSEGSITAASLVGPLQGMTLADLVAAINAGNAYVNVHTTGIPGGEVRGQIGQ